MLLEVCQRRARAALTTFAATPLVVMATPLVVMATAISAAAVKVVVVVASSGHDCVSDCGDCGDVLMAGAAVAAAQQGTVAIAAAARAADLDWWSNHRWTYTSTSNRPSLADVRTAQMLLEYCPTRKEQGLHHMYLAGHCT